MIRDAYERAEQWAAASERNSRSLCLLATSATLVVLWTAPYGLLGVPYPIAYVGRYAGTALLAGAWLPPTLEHLNVPMQLADLTTTVAQRYDCSVPVLGGDDDGS